MNVHQINLQRQFGGGETYTAFMCQALARLGHKLTLVRHRQAAFWEKLSLPDDIRFIDIDSPHELAQALPSQPAWLMSHTYLPPAATAPLARQHLLTGMAHMPIQGRRTDGFTNYRMVFAVSEHVLSGLRQARLPAWPSPLYGMAALDRQTKSGGAAAIVRHSLYEWDRRKVRDRLLSCVEPVYEGLRARQIFARDAGLTLGIVSRITTIKQFDRLFAHIAPQLKSFPGIRLEIFGSGGYASIRDLKKALRPIKDQVRFWGHQDNVRKVYGELDYLMTGLPEKEALGLNVLEAQVCDLPVLAVKAPPFTETVVEGITGFFYRDPREDEGADFCRLIRQLQSLEHRLRPRHAEENLRRFSFDAFVDRVLPLTKWAERELSR